jgi:serine protease AprX
MNLLFTIFIFFHTFISAADASRNSASLIERLEKGETIDAILVLNSSADLKNAEKISDRKERIRFVYEALKLHAQKTQSPIIEKIGTKEFQSFHIVNAIHISKLSSSIWNKISPLRSTFQVEENTPAKLKEVREEKKSLHAPSADTLPGNLLTIGVDKVWNELKVKGDGIVIAGQDGGFAWQHPALKNQYRGFLGLKANHNFHWHDAIHRGSNKEPSCANGDSPEPCDDSGHGTHTMGTMIGDDGGINQIGVAPEAKWIGCRNMKKGVGTPVTYLECFEFFLSPYPKGGNSKDHGDPALAPHIVNNSWACPEHEGCKGEEFLQAIRSLHAAGILVVVAAGNEGPGCESMGDPPGNYVGEVLSIGSIDHRNGNISDFSSRGPSSWNGGIGPNFTAPGSLIRSSIPPGRDGLYDYKSGTSMASPHVAGAVALLWSAVPSWIGKIPETMRLLEITAEKKNSSQSCRGAPGNQIPNATYGHGIINIYRAIQKAKEFPIN